MDLEATINTLLHGIQLKQTARTGWGQRGVGSSESVADHSYGVAMAVVILAPLLEQPIDLGKALAMTVIHDLPEALTSDIPSPAWRLMPEGAKPYAEDRAMQQIVDGVEGADQLLTLWYELKERQTPESRLVHDADKIDLYLQALTYERQSGNRRLGEFWQKPAEFYFAPSQTVYQALKQSRPVE